MAAGWCPGTSGTRWWPKPSMSGWTGSLGARRWEKPEQALGAQWAFLPGLRVPPRLPGTGPPEHALHDPSYNSLLGHPPAAKARSATLSWPAMGWAATTYIRVLSRVTMGAPASGLHRVSAPLSMAHTKTTAACPGLAHQHTKAGKPKAQRPGGSSWVAAHCGPRPGESWGSPGPTWSGSEA